MIIEITTRYIIGKNTLNSIIEDYTLYDHDDCECFNSWLIDRIENEYFDEKNISGDIEPIYKLCKMAERLENEKNKVLEM